MKVKLNYTQNKETIDAQIVRGEGKKLPSFHDGWRFNFSKHSKDKEAETYILTTIENPETIEGCLIFKMRYAKEPYMSYLEIASHNKGKSKKYDNAAGCLIAFASRLSFMYGKGDYKGWLAFDVMEHDEKSQKSLMALYSRKYRARKFSDTTMFILPEDGEWLIETNLGM